MAFRVTFKCFILKNSLRWIIQEEKFNKHLPSKVDDINSYIWDFPIMLWFLKLCEVPFYFYNSFDWLVTYVPYWWCGNPRRWVYRLVRLIQDCGNRNPNAWHRFLPNALEGYVLFAFAPFRWAQGWQSPGPGMCHTPPYGHPKNKNINYKIISKSKHTRLQLPFFKYCEVQKPGKINREASGQHKLDKFYNPRLFSNISSIH